MRANAATGSTSLSVSDALNRSTSSKTVEGTVYVPALASFVRRHEAKLAEFVRRPNASTAPSWSTILSLGIIASDVPQPRKPPLVLQFDPHHLYFLLLKFDELGIPNLGDLDVRIEGGVTRPMSVNFGGLDSNGSEQQPHQQQGWLGGFGTRRDSDTASFRSGMSSFSLGSGWWGASKPSTDESVDVKYLYASCTKLPALKLTPFSVHSAGPLAGYHSSSLAVLSKAVKDFEDCPPEETAVPLYAFKNLQNLVLEDLDPRGFLGWDVLSAQLRSLELHRSGIEDVGELICDVVVEDVERRKNGTGRVGIERRRRQQGSTATTTNAAAEPHDHEHLPSDPHDHSDDDSPHSPSSSSYPVPPRYAWSQLRHLSLANNSLTFVPSPPLHHLASSLTSFDLSSNLLISVPSGLSHLHSLKSLNLSDNMIDSLVGIPRILGAIQVLNLSHNRLTNLAGLDRLLALERIDVRSNRLEEALEISRLQELPHLREVWIEGNPFARPVAEGGEESYRSKCLGYFGGDVTLDALTNQKGGASKSNIRRSASAAAGLGSAGRARTEEARTAGEAKLVSRRVVTSPHHHHHHHAPSPPLPPIPDMIINTSSPTSSPTLHPTPPPGKKGSTRKPRRIVDLDNPPTYNTSVATGDSSTGLSNSSDRPQHHHHSSSSSNALTTSIGGQSKSLSATNSSGIGTTKRREKVPASTFEEPSSPSKGNGNGSGNEGGEAFRKRIEQLRNEVGDSWLSVLGEREERRMSQPLRRKDEERGKEKEGAQLERALAVGGHKMSEVESGAKKEGADSATAEGSEIATADEALTTTVTKVVKAGANGSESGKKKKKKKKGGGGGGGNSKK